MSKPGVVIIGAGHGGFQTAKSLRDRGYEGKITLIDSEEHEPYQRPPLSKSYLKRNANFDDIRFADSEFYDAASIEMLLTSRVSMVDRKAKKVTLADGTIIPYAFLVFATGARARQLQIEGASSSNVHVLRRIADAEALITKLNTAKNVVVIGAGFIGLEFVSVALENGIKPTVLEFADRVMGRAASLPVSEFFRDLYVEAGARLHLGCGVAEFEVIDDKVVNVIDTHGGRHEADLVVVGIGVEPETDIAAEAGLKVNNGIVVDECLQTSDDSIFAIGDCCNYPSVHAQQNVRLESVQNATDQARSVASAITGNRVAYREVPWFWSDQGNKKLQIAGLNFGYDSHKILGDPESGRFSVLMFKEDRLVAADSVNMPMDHMNVRRLLMTGKNLPPSELSDPQFNLKEYVRK